MIKIFDKKENLKILFVNIFQKHVFHANIPISLRISHLALFINLLFFSISKNLSISKKNKSSFLTLLLCIKLMVRRVQLYQFLKLQPKNCYTCPSVWCILNLGMYSAWILGVGVECLQETQPIHTNRFTYNHQDLNFYIKLQNLQMF